MALETFEAGYAGASPPRTGPQWSGMWKLSQNVDRIIDGRWPQPWELAGARSDFPTLSVASQETASADVQFSVDGTKFYVIGTANRTVYQYSCAIPWDVNAASYDSKSFSVNAQDAVTPALFFKSDGLKFYVLGDTNNSIFQYSCATAWDISTASYDSISFSVNVQEASPTGLFFKDDGTKFYIVGTGYDSVFQYSCSTAWDVSTASYDSKSFSVTSQENTPTGLFFKDDGTKFYIVGSTSDTVFQYSCSTAWDVSTASYDSKSFNVSSQENTPNGLFFKDDGTKFYIVGQVNDRVYQYSCSTAWDISTGNYAAFPVGAQEGNPFDVQFKLDGTKFYVIGTANRTVYQYSCAIPWDVNAASYDSKSFSVNAQDSDPQGLFFKPDGTKFYVVAQGNDRVYQYSCSTAWDISTASYDSISFSVVGQDNAPQGLFFKPDGTKFYIVGQANDRVYQYSCSTAWDISTASYDSKLFSVTAQEGSPTGLFFKDDGTRFYIVGTGNDRVFQYSCSTAWDVSTASYDNISFSVANQELFLNGVFFKSDGTKFYIVGLGSDTVYQYSLLLE